MSRGQRRRPPAGWAGPRNLSEEGKAFTATHPSLYLHVWCNFSGVNCVAYVDHLDRRGRLQRSNIAQATWRPPEVTERLVVEWGARALRTWLEGQAEAANT